MQSLLFQNDNQENDNKYSSSQFKCPPCDSMFAFKQGLNWHWKGVHHHSLDTLATPMSLKPVADLENLKGVPIVSAHNHRKIFS